MEECARYRFKMDTGDSPPLTLLPDGSYATGKLLEIIDGFADEKKDGINGKTVNNPVLFL